ncbi:hypothetical protein MJO29_007006 [Puccinia striiformis f. sp. tritici]|nr:hypothetical protein Pst134EB_014148 [Puccinia striiformis f. sp. tritici]KAI7955607.1 hypothetical protein MJO29_007006 [Puccinia striiformis f. sp. tritici]KAI9622709.1 hypothetical protein H4Q26_014990 [Puccinia striiformis f. sp. tritici PST-130]
MDLAGHKFARAVPAVQLHAVQGASHIDFEDLAVGRRHPDHYILVKDTFLVMAVQKRKLTRLERRAEPMQHVIPHEPPTEEDLRSQTPTSTTNSRQLELKDKRTTRKPKSLSNKQKLKIQRGVEISDKLLNKSSKKHARKENRDAAKKIYE